MANAHCPVCGLVVVGEPGDTVPPHQPPDKHGQCSGTGSTAN